MTTALPPVSMGVWGLLQALECLKESDLSMHLTLKTTVVTLIELLLSRTEGRTAIDSVPRGMVERHTHIYDLDTFLS